jgi:hypothetical protein
MNLCKGNPISTIERALKMITPKIRQELSEYLKVENNNSAIAAALAIK